jgi:hypothetical protein
VEFERVYLVIFGMCGASTVLHYFYGPAGNTVGHDLDLGPKDGRKYRHFFVTLGGKLFPSQVEYAAVIFSARESQSRPLDHHGFSLRQVFVASARKQSSNRHAARMDELRTRHTSQPLHGAAPKRLATDKA